MCKGHYAVEPCSQARKGQILCEYMPIKVNISFDSHRRGCTLRYKYIYIYAPRYLVSQQTPSPPSLGDVEPASRTGAPSPVPGLGVFRSPGSAPAQIRELAGLAARAVRLGRTARQKIEYLKDSGLEAHQQTPEEGLPDQFFSKVRILVHQRY